MGRTWPYCAFAALISEFVPQAIIDLSPLISHEHLCILEYSSLVFSHRLGHSRVLQKVLSGECPSQLENPPADRLASPPTTLSSYEDGNMASEIPLVDIGPFLVSWASRLSSGSRTNSQGPIRGFLDLGVLSS